MEAPTAALTASGWSGRHAVELYVRTYSTMLQSSGEIRLDTLVQAHLTMASSLHPLASRPQMDMGAFIYAVRRLPGAINRARRVVLGQSLRGFQQALAADLTSWRRVKAPARRRAWYYDGESTLAVLLASPSDIDDLVPTLVAYQIEWNKLHRAVREVGLDPERVRFSVQASEDDWRRLWQAWGPEAKATLALAGQRECHLLLRMIGGSHVGYARGAALWWQPAQAAIEEQGLAEAPVYFVSSNLHSLVNLLSGVPRRLEREIVEHASRYSPELTAELRKLEAGLTPASRDNWLYFAARGLFDQHPEAPAFRRRRAEMEAEVGIRHLAAERMGIDSAIQVVRLAALDPEHLDPRLGAVDAEALRASPAVLVNIDYPLGIAAYHILRQIAQSVPWLRGVYVLGKAATLNADVGDVMIPNVIYNEHSANTYWLDNCFSAADVQPYLVFGSVLDNQRAVTVRGTFLQNRDYLELYYRGRYTVVEMEAGPYLDACFEIQHPDRHPMHEHVNMSRLGFDLGIIHYASDTPYTQARTLGARGLSYRGMDATYAAAIAVARRVFASEGVLAEEDGGCGPRG
ncbi:MAG TPA: hypothetical protein VFD01_06440 [Candidatus Dormibacteraeota bacterium]|jgi:hypothetical protein|nr:hypothetical protein [Candidatus Dormibacteraeota bacterium]